MKHTALIIASKGIGLDCQN